MAGLNDFAGAAPKMNVSGMQEESGPVTNGELMAEARRSLSGKWFFVIISMILYYILFSCVGLLFSVTGKVVGQLSASNSDGGMPSGILWTSFGLGIASLFITSFFTYGWFNYFRVLVSEGEPRLDALFEGGRKIFSTVITYILLFGLYLAYEFASFALVMFMLNGNLLGMLIILGVIQFLPIYLIMRYSMVFFILTDDEYGPFGAMGRSSEIMVGFKWKLFCLFFRFWLLGLLVVLPGLLVAFGVPYAISYEYIPAESTPLLAVASGIWGILFMLWLVPYFWAAFATFYEDIK